MVTYALPDRFRKDLSDLDEEDRERFRVSVRAFIEDLKSGRGFRPGLRVKRVQGTRGIWEMTWAPNGRATWEYGPTIDGEPHVVWRRIGTHDILRAP